MSPQPPNPQSLMQQMTPGRNPSAVPPAFGGQRQAAAMGKLNQLLGQKMPFRHVYYKTLKKGSLIYMQYLYWHADPNPLVIVTDVGLDRIRGINLHYLTFRYVKDLLNHYCGQSMFSYKFIMHDPYIVNAFRTYKKSGLRNLQLLDCDVINTQLEPRRKAYKYNPQEIKSIRDLLRQQLQRLANPKAQELADKYVQMLGVQPGFEDLSRDLQQDARRMYRPDTSIAGAGQSAAVPTQSATQPGTPLG